MTDEEKDKLAKVALVEKEGRLMTNEDQHFVLGGFIQDRIMDL